MRLPEAPPVGDLTVTAEVLAPGGRIAGGTLEVSTRRRLTRRDARGSIRRMENVIAFLTDDREFLSGCGRASPLRFACRIRRAGRGRCTGGVIVTQQPDGRHIRFVGKRRAC